MLFTDADTDIVVLYCIVLWLETFLLLHLVKTFIIYYLLIFLHPFLYRTVELFCSYTVICIAPWLCVLYSTSLSNLVVDCRANLSFQSLKASYGGLFAVWGDCKLQNIWNNYVGVHFSMCFCVIIEQNSLWVFNFF